MNSRNGHSVMKVNLAQIAAKRGENQTKTSTMFIISRY